ncbi:MAG: hypothetical protein WAL60_17835, partial [Candidatus Sulfotelmatobacter sp.]
MGTAAFGSPASAASHSARVERAPSPAAFDFDFAFAFDLVGELACKERSDAAGQFVGKRGWSARAVGAG